MKQQPTKAAPTAAQLSVIHSLQSAGQAAGISLVVGIGQYLVTGNINVSVLLTVLGSAFLGAGTMVYKSVSANPALAQAALDTANEAIARIEQLTPSWLNADVQKIQNAPKPAPKPITYAPPAQQPQATNGLPVDYYTRNYSVQPRASVADIGTQGYMPAINQVQQQQFNAVNQVPPAMSFLQQNQAPQSALEQLRSQQGG